MCNTHEIHGKNELRDGNENVAMVSAVSLGFFNELMMLMVMAVHRFISSIPIFCFLRFLLLLLLLLVFLIFSQSLTDLRHSRLMHLFVLDCK